MEKNRSGVNGFIVLTLIILMVGAAIYGLAAHNQLWMISLFALGAIIAPGFIIVNPNQSAVLILFGTYCGTIKNYGFHWVNPLMVRKSLSLRARNFDVDPIKVNDKVGNPIMIGFGLVWKVDDTFKATFDVDNYEDFVVVQSDAALRKIAGKYPYDNFNNEDADITLRGCGDEVSQQLEEELRERLQMAGVHVIEARINHIAYASEIAGAMLRRQQASAIVAAREQIVEGAVGMVQLALNQLSDKNIIEFDDEKKAAMVSNLMVVLCSDESASPIINAGTLHQ